MKNRFLAVIFALGILFGISSICSAAEYRETVTVGIKYGSSAVSEALIKSSDALTVYNAETGDVLYTGTPGEAISIISDVNAFTSADKFYAPSVQKISVQPQNGQVITLDSTSYRGYILLSREANGLMTVINVVGTEDYVASVLGKEMSYSWPKEALKAQAVCARNFVLCRGNSHKGYDFDVCTTTHCQVYAGLSGEHESTINAAYETKGMLATYNGAVVPLYFYATSGGYTEDVENVWGSKHGYLKAVPDTYENPQKASKYKWSVTLTKEQIEEKLQASGVNIGALKDITVDKVSESDRVTQMTFIGDSGSHTVKREKCRTSLGLYSQKFTVLSGNSPNEFATLYTTIGDVKGPFYITSGGTTVSLSSFSVIDGSGKISTLNTKTTTVAPDTYVIDGGGYGHGVGMSQWGARGMAENGFTYDEILKHYFTGIELE